MKKLLFTAITIILIINANAQFNCSCLPDGITFTTQAQIDSFPINYPGCTEIEGDVLIGSWPSSDIHDLSALNVITHFGGDLEITWSDSLTNLNGLENVTSIDGVLEVIYVNNLTDLAGLENLASVGESLFIIGTLLSDLSGLDNLNNIGGELNLYSNSDLASLAGLESLTMVGGDLRLGGDYSGGSFGNPNLTSLSGLNNLDSIGGELYIVNSPLLTSLEGLESLSSLNSLYIEDVSMNSLAGLEGITSVPGSIRIAKSSLGSMTGLDNLVSIGSIMGIYQVSSLTNLEGLSNLNNIGGELNLYSNSDLTSLAGLDNIITVAGDLRINKNAELTSLTGLEGLTSVEGSLGIGSNPKLENLTGLNNLIFVGYLAIGQGSNGQDNLLTSLAGLENLTTIANDLSISYNVLLTNLSELENLNTIGGGIFISTNTNLTNLEGLENVNPGSISNLTISYNPQLTHCAVRSICDYLAAPNGEINIYDNATGCNSQEEVEAACSQPCLPEGIQFTTQAQIDSFPINHPWCNMIEGDVLIGTEGWGSTDIHDLSALSGITSFGGDLWIIHNHSLTNLNGLENVTSIDGNFKLYSNHVLTSLTGLENLTTIQGYLWISLNWRLQTLNGLNNLQSVQGMLIIGENGDLSKLEGLESLSYIGGGIHIDDNPLEDLDELSGVTLLKGCIAIHGNHNLISIDGMSNIDMDSVSDLSIYGNTSLSTCSIQNICTYLQNPHGVVQIFQNAEGCNSPAEVASDCGFTIGCLPYGDYYFISQKDIDDFPQNYQGCSHLAGDVVITGDDIVDLSGLEMVKSIDGDLKVGTSDWLGLSQGTPLLSNISGLTNLDSIGGSLFFKDNPLLSSLSGLSHLNYIGGSLSIYKTSLTNLTGLENLEFLGQGLFIGRKAPYTNWPNPELVSLDGIENIAANSIDTIVISNNPKLATCHVNSICNFLGSQGGHITIHDNATGCNTIEQVSDSCSVGIDEVLQGNNFIIYPNPVFDHINISGITKSPGNIILRIFNSNGSLLDQKQYASDQSGKMEIHLNMNAYTAGMYFIQLQAGEKVISKKISKL